MLVDHADAERLGVARVAHDRLLPVDQELAAVGLVEAHDAFDERRLAGAVLAEQGVERARRHLDRNVLQRLQRAEGLAHADRLERGRADGGHGIASMKGFDEPTAPNTPPCIVTILIAARWLP